MRDYLVLDLETVTDRELFTPPETPPGGQGPAGPPQFPPLWAHRPVVVGALWLDERYHFRRLGVIASGAAEPALLGELASLLERERPRLVTWNGRGFDLPVITLRCLRHGIPLSFYYQDRDYRDRYSDGGHLDLCDLLSERGAARSISLDAAARVIGLPGKIGVDGGKVESLFLAGQLAAIEDYCLSDVVQTAFVLLRLRLLQGALPRDHYRAAAAALVDGATADGRLAPLLARIDRPRLLLEAT